MSSDDPQMNGNSAALALIEQLETTGFFDQMRDLDSSIKKIVEDLETLGGLATQRVQETENLAAHVLAIEAILAAILETYPIDSEAVQVAIHEMMPDSADDSASSPAVQSVVDSLLKTSGK